ncbi:MAG TPA: DUF2268 domain-containing putative Zn-dependent protease [Patescibacteria group bacterium]|nr:DUF2268 domain-containing putative Zn-dependent protease [Patescibacteria group bacterium]
MHKYDLKIGTKKIGGIFSFLDYNDKIQNREEFVKSFVSKIKPIMGFGYAGFSHEIYLESKLQNSIFDIPADKIKKFTVPEKEIIDLLKTQIKLVMPTLPLEKLNIYVFPTFSTFVKKNMGGTTGTTPWKNTMLVFIDPKKNWKKYLAGTFIHEYNHAAAFQYHTWTSLINKLVFEGLAEVFLEEIDPHAPLKIGPMLSLQRSKKIYSGIKSKSNSKSVKLYNEIFYDNKKYPLWAGYSIGYWIVKTFREKNLTLSWKDILKLSHKTILKESKF